MRIAQLPAMAPRAERGAGARLALARAAALGAGLAAARCAATAGATAGGHATPARAATSAVAGHSATGTSAAAASPTATASPRLAGPLPVAPGQGRLRQTRVKPKAHGPQFRAMVTDLWLAVSRDRPSLARPAFFPLAAYKQVKAIYNAAGDGRRRAG